MHFVLSDEETRSLETVEVWIVDVEPIKAQAVLKAFSPPRFPIKDLGHLKRIRKTNVDGQDVLSILLCAKDAADQASVVELLGESLTPYIHEVSRWPPLTRSQFDSWKRFWPMYWRETAVRRDPLSDTDRKKYQELLTQSLLPYVRKLQSVPQCAGLAYDPSMDRIVAMAHDNREKHPLKHAAMNLIEAVAQTEHEEVTKEDESSVPGSSTSVVPRKRKTVATDEETGGSDSYLCSNLVAIFTHEPCVMCSMALLHSRVGSVIYALPASRTGGLGSVFKVHSERNLNHKFNVWRDCAAESVMAMFGAADNSACY